MKNAQISTEMLMAIGVAILVFFLLIPIINDKKENINDLESYLSERKDCIKITNAVTSVYANDITTNLTITHNATIMPYLVIIGDTTCTYPMNAISNLTDYIFTINTSEVNFTKYNDGVIVQYV